MSKLNLGTKAGKAKGDMWVAEGGENIEALPGMGEATVKALAEVGVTTTAQLTGIALSFFSTGTTAKVRSALGLCSPRRCVGVSPTCPAAAASRSLQVQVQLQVDPTLPALLTTVAACPARPHSPLLYVSRICCPPFLMLLLLPAAPCLPAFPRVLQQRAERFYDWLRENVAPLTSFRSAVVRCIFERLQRNGFPDLLEGIAEGDEEAEGEDA